MLLLALLLVKVMIGGCTATSPTLTRPRRATAPSTAAAAKDHVAQHAHAMLCEGLLLLGASTVRSPLEVQQIALGGVVALHYVVRSAILLRERVKDGVRRRWCAGSVCGSGVGSPAAANDCWAGWRVCMVLRLRRESWKWWQVDLGPCFHGQHVPRRASLPATCAARR